MSTLRLRSSSSSGSPLSEASPYSLASIFIDRVIRIIEEHPQLRTHHESLTDTLGIPPATFSGAMSHREKQKIAIRVIRGLQCHIPLTEYEQSMVPKTAEKTHQKLEDLRSLNPDEFWRQYKETGMSSGQLIEWYIQLAGLNQQHHENHMRFFPTSEWLDHTGKIDCMILTPHGIRIGIQLSTDPQKKGKKEQQFRERQRVIDTPRIISHNHRVHINPHPLRLPRKYEPDSLCVAIIDTNLPIKKLKSLHALRETSLSDSSIQDPYTLLTSGMKQYFDTIIRLHTIAIESFLAQIQGDPLPILDDSSTRDIETSFKQDSMTIRLFGDGIRMSFTFFSGAKLRKKLESIKKNPPSR